LSQGVESDQGNDGGAADILASPLVVRAPGPSIVPRFVGDLGDAIVRLDEAAFDEHRRMLSSELVREALAAQAAELARAREKSERLLLSILPGGVANQLKDGAATIAEAQDDVTVLFVDICGFTRLSGGSGAAEVVQMLNKVFSAFDALVGLHSVEKKRRDDHPLLAWPGLIRSRPAQRALAPARRLSRGRSPGYDD